MTQSEGKQAFMTLQSDQQQRVLALLALNVTIAARSIYAGSTDDALATRKLRAFNEVLHRIVGQFVHLIDNDAKRYPDDVLVDILFELAQKEDCARLLADAFARSLSIVKNS